MKEKTMRYIDEKVAFDDGALYIISFKELFDNGTYRVRTVKRHAFNINHAFDNFVIECKTKGVNFEFVRICQAYESRRFFYS